MAHYQSIDENVFVVSDFFSPEECQAYIELSEGMGYGDAPITTSMGFIMRPDIRNNTRVILDDKERANVLWERAKEYLPKVDSLKPIGVNERFRFYRYDPGEKFYWHRDGYYARDNGERSYYTFMIYLNDGYEGGETSFTFGKIPPKQGMALFFLHPLLHQGDEVSEGRKYVLRTDVMYSLY
ncbi:MAG: 2OG-Fe(II) oxygenase [Planctomycetota bacterium]|nr:2OG-Fe(II) oxygenase [Planctomycetota bacterium]